jgi:hypothetical protein
MLKSYDLLLAHAPESLDIFEGLLKSDLLIYVGNSSIYVLYSIIIVSANNTMLSQRSC